MDAFNGRTEELQELAEYEMKDGLLYYGNDNEPCMMAIQYTFCGRKMVKFFRTTFINPRNLSYEDIIYRKRLGSTK